MSERVVDVRPRYTVGLDLGQSSDYTAAVVLERTLRREREGKGPDKPTDKFLSHYAARFIKRWQLKTPYDVIISDVVQLVGTPPLANPKLAVDTTGVGRPVLDVLLAAKPAAWVRPVLITAGHAVTFEDGAWHVPKKELVSTLQVLLQSGRLKIANLPERELLVRELQNFKVKITVSATETFEAWREKDHDDLVLATALAAWVAENEGDGGGFYAVGPEDDPEDRRWGGSDHFGGRRSSDDYLGGWRSGGGDHFGRR